MNVFLPQVIKAAPTANDARDRRWIYLPYDRLTDRAGPLQNTGPNQCGIVMVESLEKGSRRPYHKKKLALLLANERHFAREQAARGVKVIYIFTPGTFGDGLLDVQKKYALKQITSTRPAERELRLDLNQARRQGLQLEEVEDETWLTTEAQFDTIYPSPQTFLMDRFYRAMRKHTGLLMEPGKPIGGKFSYDYENRKPFRGEVRVPNRPSYPPDEITTEVLCLVELYWSFLERNSDQLSGNQRLAMPKATMRKKPLAERKALRERARVAIEELERVPRPDYEPAGKR